MSERTYTAEEIERAILEEENGWKILDPAIYNIVEDVLDNVRIHLGLPRPMLRGAMPPTLQRTLGFEGRSRE